MLTVQSEVQGLVEGLSEMYQRALMPLLMKGNGEGTRKGNQR